MSSRVTLVIPTLDRPAFLYRQLFYYMRERFRGDILIGDSTEQVGFQRTSHWLSEFSSHLTIRHYHLPGLSCAGVMQELTKEVRTPYVAMSPDDDFLIPSALAQCADFLDREDGYIAAHGLGVLISSDEELPDRISAVQYYRQPVLSDDLACDRVKKHLQDYLVSLFSIHRREIFAKAYGARPSAKDHPLCGDKSFSDELLECTLLAAYGKIAQIDCLYLVRQAHNTRHLLPDWYQWLTSEQWGPSYRWYRDKVAAAICEVDDIPLQRGREAVDSGFAEYLQKLIGKRAQGPEGLVARIRRIVLRHLPGSVRAVLLRFRARGTSRHISTESLESLMQPASPYHRDFLQIYNAVTRQKA